MISVTVFIFNKTTFLTIIPCHTLSLFFKKTFF
nr:MAG TPA: hypothetical protein [Caudoviricetes sp.]